MYHDFVLVPAVDHLVMVFEALGGGEIEPSGHLVDDDPLKSLTAVQSSDLVLRSETVLEISSRLGDSGSANILLTA